MRVLATTYLGGTGLFTALIIPLVSGQDHRFLRRSIT